VLVLVWILVVVSVGANWASRVRGLPRVELVSKPAATISIGLLAVAVSDGAPTAAVVAAVAGFALCLGGDIALLPSVDKFVVGLGLFLAGHLAFVVMFAILGLDRWVLGLVAAAGVLAISPLVVVRVIKGAASKDASLRLPVIAYFGVISTMAVVGWATGIAAALIGSALFLASDSILGWREFVGSKRWMPLAVMATYHGALVGLALTLA
jgi:alkenylglycerophosphocholine hydrolase